MKKIIPAAFFDRPTLTVARDLLGTWIVHRTADGSLRALMITEVEAYDGPNDRASHASRGVTPRTKVMFGPAGAMYVYFIYGMHWMANVVTGPAGYPAAVLLRAGAYREGTEGQWKHVKGPGLLTRHLGISGKENGLAAAKAQGIWFEDRGPAPRGTRIVAGKRVGVAYAGPVWREKRYNLTLVLPPHA